MKSKKCLVIFKFKHTKAISKSMNKMLFETYIKTIPSNKTNTEKQIK